MSFTLRPSIDGDFQRMAEIINVTATFSTTAEELLETNRKRPADRPYTRIAAVDAHGQLLAYGAAMTDPTMQPGHFFVRIRVDQTFSRQGIGTALHSELSAWAASQGAVALETDVQETDPDAFAWACRQDYAEVFRLFESALELASWDPAPFAGALERLQSEGIRFSTVADEGDRDELLPRLYDLVMANHGDVPGWEDRPQPSLELWSGWVKENPYWNPRSIMLAIDGDHWIAMSEVHTLPEAMYNSYTGTRREYRCRGLALAIKVLALDWAKANGGARIITENHTRNHPMLAVNQKLGYVPAPGTVHLIKRLGGN